MNNIGQNIEENVLKQLQTSNHWEIPQKLFGNLMSICLLHSIPLKIKGKRIERVSIELTKGDKSIGTFEAKPFVRGERLMLSFIEPTKLVVDASFAFGEDVQRL